MLIGGFRELSLQAMAPPPAPEPARSAAVAAAERRRRRSGARAAEFYASSDANVVPPVALRQELPPYPGTLIQADGGRSSKS